MKSFTVKRKFLILTLIALFSAISFIFAGSLSFARADDLKSANTSIYLPFTSAEYADLSSPLDCVCWGDDGKENYAIINDTQSLYISEYGKTYTNGASYKVINFTSSENSLFQINKYAGNNLIYSSQSKLFLCNLDDYSISNLTYESTLGETQITATCFDLNDNYLVASNGTKIFVYSLGSNISCIGEFNSYEKSLVRINEKNDIFYVGTDGYLHKVSVNSIIENGGTIAVEESPIITCTPKAFAVNNDYLYYFNDGVDLHRYAIYDDVDNKDVTLTFPDSDYDLGGKAISPSAISFKGENLLIIDSDSNGKSIQEFKVEGDALTFTGFAIAKDKTAFNRIKSTVKEVEKTNDAIAFLDDNKLTVINKDNSFINISSNELTVESSYPQSFALGDDSALFLYSSNKVRLLSLKNKTEVQSFSYDRIIHDICYQSGYYYLLMKGLLNEEYNKYFVVKIDDLGNQTTLISNKTLDDTDSQVKLCVDVLGNIYFATSKSISYCSLENDFSQDKHLTDSVSGLIKMQTDLNGSMYALYVGNKVVKYQIDGSSISSTEFSIITTDLDGQSTPPNVSSFAMDYVDNTVIFIFDEKEYVFKTNGLDNASIKNMNLTEAYVHTDANADINNLKFYSVNKNSNAYVINYTANGFEHDSLLDCKDYQFTLVKELEQQGVNYLLLAGNVLLDTNEHKDVVILVNKINATELNLIETTSVTTSYVATNVNMYYLPIITRDGRYSLSNLGAQIRLDKKTPFTVYNVFNFGNKLFYYATANLEGVTYTGYIPVDFTVELLSEYNENSTFSIEMVNQTTVYLDAELTNELCTLADGTQIKKFNDENGVSKISFVLEGVEVLGYVKTDAIKTIPNTTITNVLVLFIAITCATVSSLYFILKKKPENKQEAPSDGK